MEELCEEHRIALLSVVKDLVKTDQFKIRIEPGSRKGKTFINVLIQMKN